MIRNGVVTLLIATSSLARAQERPPTPPSLPSPENVTRSNAAGIDYLVRTYGASADEAAQRLAAQEEISDAAANIAAELGDRFGGIYIEHQPAFRIVVLAKSSDGASVPRAIAASPRLQRSTEVRATDRSQAEAQALVERLSGLFRAAGARTVVNYDLRTQRLIATAPTSAALQALTRLVPADLQALVTTRVGSLPQEIQAGFVSGDYTYGGWPLYRTDNSLGCSSGFVVRMSDSRFGVTTAGHCSQRSYKLWVNNHYVTLEAPAIQHNAARYDYKVYPTGSLDVSGYVAYFNNQPISGYPSIVNSVRGYPDSGYFGVQDGTYRVAHNLGAVMCKSGARTGLSCGEIVETNATYTTVDGVTRSGMIALGRSTQRVLGFGGDSGSPVFTPPSSDGTIRPAGLVSSVNGPSSGPCDTSTQSGCLLYYMPVERLKDQQPMQIRTMNGTLNP